MPIVPLAELPRLLLPGRRLLGLDLGTKTIGLALADVSCTIATPGETIARTRLARDLDRLEALVEQLAVGGFVLGLPVEMNGREGKRCQATRQFARDLLGRVDRPLAFWDERLSTAAVERVLIGEANLGRRRRQAVVDKAAAAWILQGALDAMSRPPPAY